MDRENKCALIHRVDLINPKFQVSNHLLWLNSPICVRPGLKPRRQFFELRGFYILEHVSINITCCRCPQSLSSSFLMKMGSNSISNISFIRAFFLYNFFQNFLQYMYFFSAVFGLKVGSEIHFYLCHNETIITIEPRHEKICLLGF